MFNMENQDKAEIALKLVLPVITSVFSIMTFNNRSKKRRHKLERVNKKAKAIKDNSYNMTSSDIAKIMSIISKKEDE